ncbi:uncharacterized protein BO97DRAFT_148239 [Aspergillus homomorphus CBS 101889]|uniref:Uncharacterized protein n=1 Tax=Aspergillus homomorphus (strain CBS 101889) TaxID=1450537 RepID=A0A395HQ72_ASPHC|nr:hypothetical protein BO97DRAFT_148239 [Aspergillus homomorphus CBS 101889]RAL10091.1 hypothetical protein BO97DRAFT_148239 [Aspergillus homomorphus CBS 101889]
MTVTPPTGKPLAIYSGVPVQFDYMISLARPIVHIHHSPYSTRMVALTKFGRLSGSKSLPMLSEGRRAEDGDSQIMPRSSLAVSEYPCSLRSIAFCTNGTHRPIYFPSLQDFPSRFASTPNAEHFTPPCGYQPPPLLCIFCRSLRCAFPLS